MRVRVGDIAVEAKTQKEVRALLTVAQQMRTGELRNYPSTCPERHVTKAERALMRAACHAVRDFRTRGSTTADTRAELFDAYDRVGFIS